MGVVWCATGGAARNGGRKPTSKFMKIGLEMGVFRGTSEGGPKLSPGVVNVRAVNTDPCTRFAARAARHRRSLVLRRWREEEDTSFPPYMVARGALVVMFWQCGSVAVLFWEVRKVAA